MSYVITNAARDVPGTSLPPMPQEVTVGGMRLIVVPPGPISLCQKLAANFFDVNLGTVEHTMALNSDKALKMVAPAETLAFAPSGTEYMLKTDNPLPGCALEVNDAILASWLERGDLGPDAMNRTTLGMFDGPAAELGRAAIRYLMHGDHDGIAPNRLTVEAIALGIAARGMAQLGGFDGDLNAEILRWNKYSCRSEINRAIDLIEARLCDSDLSISDLADAACLSSSRFSSVFRSMVGETPYAFILRRRAEFARDLIIGTREPLAQIAYDAGFSSQAHMTVVVRRVFGTTPAAMRS